MPRVVIRRSAAHVRRALSSCGDVKSFRRIGLRGRSGSGAGLIEAGMDRGCQRMDVERFSQFGDDVRTLEAIENFLRRCGHDDAFDLDRCAREGVQHLGTVRLREHEIENKKIVSVRPEAIDSFAPIRRFVDSVLTVALEDCAQESADGGVVIDDEDAP